MKRIWGHFEGLSRVMALVCLLPLQASDFILLWYKYFFAIKPTVSKLLAIVPYDARVNSENGEIFSIYEKTQQHPSGTIQITSLKQFTVSILDYWSFFSTKPLSVQNCFLDGVHDIKANTA